MLDRLTREQEALMITHRDECIDFVVNNYKYSKKKLELEDVQDDVNWIYEKAGMEKPKFIFFADSYLQEKLMINYILKNGFSECLMNDILREQIWNFRTEIIEQVYNQLREQISSILWSKFGTDVDEQTRININIPITIHDKFYEYTNNKIDPALRHDAYEQLKSDQIDEQIKWNYTSEISTKSMRQINEHVESTLIPDISAEIYRQVITQIKENIWQLVEEQVKEEISTINENVNFQVKNEITKKFYDNIDKTFCYQIDNQINKYMRDQTWSQIWIQIHRVIDQQIWLGLWDPIKYQIEDKINEQQTTKDEKLEFIEHYFGIGYETWVSFYSYFERIGVFKNDDFNRFSKFLNKGIWSIQFFRSWCIISRMPRKINRDTENRLHSLDESAVIWNRKEDKNYFIHGVSFTEELWDKVVTNKITVKEILQVSNMEQRNAILSVIPPERLINELDAKLISTHKQKKKGKEYMDAVSFNKLTHQEIKLYWIKGELLNLDEDVYILLYTDPSTTRQYFSFADPSHISSAATAMAFKFGITEEEYINNLFVET